MSGISGAIQDAKNIVEKVKRTVPQLVVAGSVVVVLLLAVIAAEARAPRRAVASLAGVVTDSSGTPQAGALVELLEPDATLVAREFTNAQGFYRFTLIDPGRYALKAVAAEYLPSLKQNLHISATTVVNMTVHTVYDLMQWAPASRRIRPASDDDWAWTLRSAESRPLLRWQDDGSPLVVSDGSAETSKTAQHRLRMRATATAGTARFAEGGEQISMAAEQRSGNRRAVAMSVAEDPDDSGLVEAMLGFRQELGNGTVGSRSIQTVAAMLSAPEVGVAGQQGLQAISARSWESMQLLESLDAEAGSDEVFARLAEGSQGGSNLVQALPFASLTLHRGSGALEYRLATARPEDGVASEATPEAWLPVFNDQNGQLGIEHGLHQELGWSTSAGPARMLLVVYGDSISNPTLEASGRLTGNGGMGQWMLVDQGSGILRGSGTGYSTTGVLAQLESQLPGGNHVRLSYATGDALVMPAASGPADIVTILRGAHARHAQMYSLALAGTMDGAGTHWRASYRWQPEATVTEVAPFAVDASEPYLNVYIRQPLTGTHEGGDCNVEVLVDMRNLLAQGYQPFLTTDGSRLFFAQAQRTFLGGLAFNF